MPLRKSPVRTAAMLAANRANGRKSTGPRTARGKHSSALNALRHGRRARLSACWVPQAGREADAFWRFEARLRDAILPLAGEGAHQVFRTALNAWITKRLYDRLAASADEDQRLQLALGFEPMPSRHRLRIRRPGLAVPDWLVTISIGLAWGRGLGRFQRFATELADDLAGGRAPNPGRRPMPRLPSLHTRLVLTTLGHPYSDGAVTKDDGGESVELGSRRDGEELRTKPECNRTCMTYKNQPAGESPQTDSPADRERAGAGAEVCEPDDEGKEPDGASRTGGTKPSGWRNSGSYGSQPIDDSEAGPTRLRTKPECIRKHEASKNVPLIGTWAAGAISAVRRLFARRPDRPDGKDAIVMA